jgi:hypothetical protein
MHPVPPLFLALIILIILFLLVAIYYHISYYKHHPDTFIPTFPTEHSYSLYGLNTPPSHHGAGIEKIMAELDTYGTVQEGPLGKIGVISETLKRVADDYFNNELRPAIEIDTWIDNLSTRLHNIHLKLVEMKITAKNDFVFY